MPRSRGKRPGPIVVIGSINMDLVCRVGSLPKPGETLLGRDFATIPGGKGANQAVAAARLADGRVDVHMIGRVGDDAFGRELLAGLKRNGVKTKHVAVTRGVASGVAMILVDDRGENSIVVAAGANARLTRGDIDAAEPLIRTASVVVMQLEIPLATVRYAAAMCRRLGVYTILDPAPAPAKPLRVPVDLLTPNETEAKAAGRSGAETLVLKLGSRGCALVTSGGRQVVASFNVRVVDTTAAGDAFTGALAVGQALAMPMPETLQMANAAGALCCTKLGAQPALPSRREVERLLVQRGE
jgi:ribokinase